MAWKKTVDPLIAHYLEKLGLKEALSSLIDHENAMVAIVYRIEDRRRGNFILKISPRPLDFRRELFFLQRLKGIVKVPEVIGTVEPESSYPGAVLMECLQGELLKKEDLSEELVFEAGVSLAKVHLYRFDRFGDPVAKDTLSKDPKAYFKIKFYEGLTECEGNLSKELLRRCRNFFEHNIHLLEQGDGPCIAHRDFRPGNILVFDRKIQGIIDWAGARSGFAEEDFCSLENGEWPFEKHHIASFHQGYGSVRPVPDLGRTLSLFKLFKAIATIGFLVKKGTSDSKNASLYRVFVDWIEKMPL